MKDTNNQEIDEKIQLDSLELLDSEQKPQPEPIITNKAVVEPANEKKPSRRKLVIILTSVAVVLIIAGFLSWLFLFKGIYVFQGLPLSSFSNSYYSLKIPEGYSKSENNLGTSGTDITFFDPDEKTTGIQSKVYVVSGEMSVDKMREYFKKLDKQYSDEAIEKSRGAESLNGAARIEYSKADRNGMDSRALSYDIMRDKDHVGRYNKISIYSNGKIYEIVISSPRNNPGLAVDAKKIFDSFEIK